MGRKVRLINKLKSLPTKWELQVRREAKIFEERASIIGFNLEKETDFNDAVKILQPDYAVERSVYLKYQPLYIKQNTKESRTKIEPVAPKPQSGKLDSDVPDTLRRKGN